MSRRFYNCHHHRYKKHQTVLADSLKKCKKFSETASLSTHEQQYSNASYHLLLSKSIKQKVVRGGKMMIFLIKLVPFGYYLGTITLRVHRFFPMSPPFSLPQASLRFYPPICSPPISVLFHPLQVRRNTRITSI